MLKFKQNILFSVLTHGPDTKDCIKSCLEQDGVNPFICVNAREYDGSFIGAKSLCENPFIYEPNYVESARMICSVGGDEKLNIGRAISFGLKNKCKYFCFIQTPTELDSSFSKKSIDLIKDEIIGTYSNLLDSGIKIYTHMILGEPNVGPVIFVSLRHAQIFNHNSVGEYISQLSRMGAFYKFDDFLVRNQWIQFTLGQSQVSNRQQ